MNEYIARGTPINVTKINQEAKLTLKKVHATIVILQVVWGKMMGVIVKKFNVSIVGLVAFLSGVLLVTAFSSNSYAALPRDCDDNSIMYCGASTGGELTQKYNENKTGDLPAIYNHYGVSGGMITAGGKMGEVRKDGSVVVDGETIATGAQSLGRHAKATGSSALKIGGKTYYQTPTSHSFASESIAAYIFTGKDGQFISAILTSCGNPVTATPKPPKKPTPPKPAYKCDALTARTVKLEDRSYAYDLAYSATGGAALKTVDYDFGDGQGRQNVSPDETKNVTHSYAKTGTYTTAATLHFDVGGAVKDVACKVTITTSPEMCPLNPSLPVGDARCAPCDVPGKEQYPKDSPLCVAPTAPTPTPPELPHTGPMDLAAGGLGLGSLIAAGSYWYASRRGLLAAWLGR